MILIGRKWSFCAHSSVVISLENQWWHHKMLAVFSGYSGTSIYKPLCNEVLSMMKDISCPTNSRICGKEPWYNETSLQQTYFVGPLALCYIKVPLCTIALAYNIHFFFQKSCFQKLFDIRFSFKRCNFACGCLLVNMASKTVIRPICCEILTDIHPWEAL